MTNQNEREIVQKIKSSYVPKVGERNKFEELKLLDKEVKRPAIIFGYVFGVLGTLILGTGMCLAMEVIGKLMPLGIVVGAIGIAIVSITYPVYQKILAKRKAKFADRIIAKSDELLNK